LAESETFKAELFASAILADVNNIRMQSCNLLGSTYTIKKIEPLLNPVFGGLEHATLLESSII